MANFSCEKKLCLIAGKTKIYIWQGQHKTSKKLYLKLHGGPSRKIKD